MTTKLNFYFILFFLIFSATAWGQAGRTVTGEVVDSLGAVIRGATINLETIDGAIVKTVATDGAGKFQVTILPAHEYLLEVSMKGFKTVRASIAAGHQKSMLVTLPVAVVNEQITVGAEPTQVNTEPAGNRDSVEVDAKLLEQLPVLDQDYISTLSMFLDIGSTGTGGVSLVVDGMEASRLGVSPSAIQQIKINNDPYAAEYFRPGRGRIEVITKPAAPEYHGTFNLIFRDSTFSAANAFASTKPAEQRRAYEGFLSGPFLHSKNTFFELSLTRQELDNQAIVFADGPSGSIRQNVAAPQRNTDASLRITHVFSDRHSANLDYSLEQSGSTNRGVGGVVLATAGTRPFAQEHQWGFTDTFTISPQFLNQFQVRYERNRDSVSSVSPEGKVVVTDAFTSGGAQVDQRRRESALHFNEIVTWTGKRQTIKAGINVPNLSFRSFDDRSNFGGTYYFSSLQSYLARQPFSYSAQQGNGLVSYKQFEMGGFLQDEIRLRPNLSITVGMRYDWQNALHDINNLAPRLSFAYAPGKKGKLVIRGGTGLFYDRTGAGPIADLIRYDGTHLQSILIVNPKYPDPFSGGIPGGTLPINLVRLAPEINIPYTVQYSISVERQLTKGSTLTASYRGTEGFDLFQSRDVNAPLPPFYLARPDVDFGTIRQIESKGSQESHAFEISLKGKITRKLTGMAQYTLSKTYNDTDGVTFFPADSVDPSGEWGRANFDQRHRLNLLETIAFGKFVNLGVGLRIYSGTPFTITTGLDQNHDGLTNERPSGASRNSGHGPGFANVDLRWFHDFKLSRSKKEAVPKITTAVDAFNLLNTTNYPAFVGNMSSPFFGRPVSALEPRRLQFTVRLTF